MFRSRTVVSALALAVMAAVPTSAVAQAPDRAHAGGASPLPPGACVTHGAVGLAYEVGVNCRVVQVDGHPRRFVVYVPASRPVTGPRAPVVFMFHGSSGTGEQFLRISGWREQADATGLVAVFPTGLRYRVLDSGRLSTKWNDYSLASQVDLSERPPGYPANAPWPANDVGFVDAMMADLGARLPIDRHRVYASGFSNGAGFTARLAVERSTVLAAAAFSGGALPAAQAPARPIPMYLTVGTLDDRVLAQTGPPPLVELPLDPLALLAEPVIKSTIGAHLATAGLDPRDFGVLGRPRSTSFRWPATGTGTGGALLRFAVLDGLHHNYPNGRNNRAGFEAAPEFWDFFRTHRLPPAGGARITAASKAGRAGFTPPIGTDKGSIVTRNAP
jgi:poly(3-hydroxybutyrate) depolymerase